MSVYLSVCPSLSLSLLLSLFLYLFPSLSLSPLVFLAMSVCLLGAWLGLFLNYVEGFQCQSTWATNLAAGAAAAAAVV